MNQDKKKEIRSRQYQVKVRLNEDELEAFKKKVEASGTTQQDYLKKCVLDKEIHNTDSIKEVMPEIKRIGNNLNQIAKRINQGLYPNIVEVTENQKELKEIWQLLKQSLQKLR